MLDLYPFATTSPIYVTVGGQPVRSPGDAAYFLAWIDRLEQNVLAFADWNSTGERDQVLEADPGCTRSIPGRGGIADHCVERLPAPTSTKKATATPPRSS